MRKPLSIFLLLVLLFNMVGYRAWFYYAEKQSDACLEASLDNNQYNETDLIAVSIPLNNPYLLEESSFQRVNGEMVVDGKNYKFVKRKVSDGKLILLCIPDTHKMVLKKAKAELGNATNELTNNGKGTSRNNIQKNFSGNDYISQSADLLLSRCSNATPKQFSFQLIKITDPHLVSPGKPPKYLA